MFSRLFPLFFFFFNDTATTEIYTLSLHDALPILHGRFLRGAGLLEWAAGVRACGDRKSTRLNSSHLVISYAVFCLKKKEKVKASRSNYVPIILTPQATYLILPILPVLQLRMVVLDVATGIRYIEIAGFFFFNNAATTKFYSLSLRDALRI